MCIQRINAYFRQSLNCYVIDMLSKCIAYLSGHIIERCIGNDIFYIVYSNVLIQIIIPISQMFNKCFICYTYSVLNIFKLR